MTHTNSIFTPFSNWKKPLKFVKAFRWIPFELYKANKEKAKDAAAMVVHHSSNVKIKLTSSIFVKKVSVAKSSPPSVTLKKSPGVDNLPANEFLLLYM